MNRTIVMVIGGVRELLRFSRDVRVAPYKRYIEGGEATEMAHRVHLTERKPTRITKQKLVPTLNFVTGTESGTDGGGLFIWSSVNPEARFSSFRELGAFLYPECQSNEEALKLRRRTAFGVIEGRWVDLRDTEVILAPHGSILHFYEVELLDHRPSRRLPLKRLKQLATY